MLKPITLAGALLAAAPALAQSPPPEFIAAAQAYGDCMKIAGPKVPATMTPEAGAQQMLTECAAKKTELDARFEAWVASPTFPEAGRAMAREQYKAQMANVPTQVADGIRKSRGAPAPVTSTPPQSAPTATPPKK